MDTERMLKPALIGGVLLGILSSLPLLSILNCFCCAWIIGGGLLAAYLYVKDSPAPVSMGSGVLVGLFAGIIGAIVSALFSIPLNFLIHGGGTDFAEQIRQAMERIPDVPPEIADAFKAPSFQRAAFLLYMLFTLVICCLFAMLGGVIGVALFEKRKPDDPSANAASYQPPTTLPPDDPSPPPPDTE